jgi:AraC-like DNA-binding protein
VSNALPYSMSNVNVPAAPASSPRPTWAFAPANRAFATPPTVPPESRTQASPFARVAFGRPSCSPAPRLVPPPIPRTMPERMVVARERIRAAAASGQRIRSYEVALDLDLSEFHFARQFRAAFGRSPHVFYDEIRAELARNLLREGLTDRDVARRVGFRRPAELRALLSKRFENAAV